MLEQFAKLVELTKIPLRLVGGIFVVVAASLFIPSSIVGKLGLLKYREEGKPYLGLSFLLLSVIIVSRVIGMVITWYDHHLFLRTKKKRLHVLTAEEVQILRGYIEGQTRTSYLSIQSGVVKGLSAEGIIYRSSNLSAPGYGFASFAHNIQPWAWQYLNEHRDLLGL
jgi:hypothetical protein